MRLIRGAAKWLGTQAFMPRPAPPLVSSSALGLQGQAWVCSALHGQLSITPELGHRQACDLTVLATAHRHLPAASSAAGTPLGFGSFLRSQPRGWTEGQGFVLEVCLFPALHWGRAHVRELQGESCEHKQDGEPGPWWGLF